MARAATLFLAMAVLAPLRADTVWLKNGGAIDGRVIQETSDRVVVDTGAGKVSIERSQVDRIERSGGAPEAEPPKEVTPAPEPEPAKQQPPTAEPPVEPGDEEGLPDPEQVRIEEPFARAAEGRLNLSLKLVQPKGAALDTVREGCRVESCTDDVGTEITGEAADFIGFTMYDEAEGNLQILVMGEPDASAKTCRVVGTIAYKFGWERRAGEVESVELAEGTTFEVEGIPFAVSMPTRPFATEEETRARTWIELRCPFGEFQPSDFTFLTDLTFWDEEGREIPSRRNQASDWSDEHGNAGFFFTYDIEGKPTVVSIRYKLWSRIGTMTVPFDVTVPITR